MEKHVLNLIKQQLPSKLDSTIEALSKKFSFFSSVGIDSLQSRLQIRCSLKPSLRLVTFFNSQGFKNYLHSFSLMYQTNYHLSSKILPLMIPRGAPVSVFHPYLFNAAINQTDRKNITYSCPFKTFQGIEHAAGLGIRTMVVNTPQEIQKIDKTNHKFNYIWEFDQANQKQSSLIFKLLSDQHIFLSGVKFKQIPISSLSEIQKCIQQGNKFGHKLLSNTYQMSVNDISLFKSWRRSSTVNLNPLINDLDMSSFVICAAKIIGKNKYTTVYSQKTKEVMEEQSLNMSLQTNLGQWALFTPKRLDILEDISDQMIKINC